MTALDRAAAPASAPEHSAGRHEPSSARYVTLDGMRGIAALAVALFHYNVSQARHGYIAVDFFFVLSGFVLCRAYFPRWQAGMGAAGFILRRVVRLYPLFLAGIAITTLSALSNRFTGHGPVYSLATMAKNLPYNFLMLPSPHTAALYPFNVPAWSLFFELLANAAMVLVLLRLPRWALLVVSLVAAALYAPVVIERDGGNIGAVWAQIGSATVRTLFSFSLGMFLARLSGDGHRLRGAVGQWSALAAMAAIAAMLFLELPQVPWALHDLVCALLLSPLLVWWGSRCEPPHWISPVARFLGDISYGLYAVHWALMTPLRYFKDDLGWNPVAMAFAYLGCCIALAWLVTRFFDVPMRRLLQDKLGARTKTLRQLDRERVSN